MSVKIKYDVDTRHVKYVNDFYIGSDKHAYQCQKCGAIFQSKSIDERTIFKTDDPKCISCDENRHSIDDLKRICACPERYFGY